LTFGFKQRPFRVHKALVGVHCPNNTDIVAVANSGSATATTYRTYAAVLLMLIWIRNRHTEVLATALLMRLNGIAKKLYFVAAVIAARSRSASCLPRPCDTATVSNAAARMPSICRDISLIA
jgi:hypothetical protein